MRVGRFKALKVKYGNRPNELCSRHKPIESARVPTFKAQATARLKRGSVAGGSFSLTMKTECCNAGFGYICDEIREPGFAEAFESGLKFYCLQCGKPCGLKVSFPNDDRLLAAELEISRLRADNRQLREQLIKLLEPPNGKP